MAEQIESILLNNDDLDLLYDNKSTALKDIRDGYLFRSIRRTNANRILTLTLNIDGVQPSRNAQSTIWPILLVINELPPHRRFALENIILGGVWSAKSKPSREDVKSLLRPLIDELLELEKGHYFIFSDGYCYPINVYLIAACCDKPAQALIQCIPEPIAAFGCGKCEVQGNHRFFTDRMVMVVIYFAGFMIATENGGHVRSFAQSHQDFNLIHERSNDRYDALIDLLQLHRHLRSFLPNSKQKKSAINDKKNEKGIVGECLLRQLAYFDVGRSFMVDSLHNIYIGAFVSGKTRSY